MLSLARVVKSSKVGEVVRVQGWVRSVRKQGGLVFLDVFDGSAARPFPVVWNLGQDDSNDSTKGQNTLQPTSSSPGDVTPGASVVVTGALVPHPKFSDKMELSASSVTVVGLCEGDSYPIQPKRHTAEFLRSVAHLRTRAMGPRAVMRVRAATDLALRNVLVDDLEHVAVHAPFLTSLDAEGAGEMFSVTSKGAVVEGKGTLGLTVSTQLHLEAFAQSLGAVYALGPCWRAEDSHTTRHAAEFWMLEAEWVNGRSGVNDGSVEDGLDALMSHVEVLVRRAASRVLDSCEEELRVTGTRDLVAGIATQTEPWARVSYREAVERLGIEYGTEIGSEEEKALAASVGGPVWLVGRPAGAGAFYMAVKEDGEIEAVDLIVPGVGEVVGGSVREHRYEELAARAPKEGLDWYVDLRKYGYIGSTGYGLGFDRLVQWWTGTGNIRDVIPMPRTAGGGIRY